MSVLQVTVNKLKTVRRDMRETGAKRRFTPRQSAAVAFARAVRRRYQAQQIYRPGIDLVFRQIRPMVAVQPTHHDTHVRLVSQLSNPGVTVLLRTHVEGGRSRDGSVPSRLAAASSLFLPRGGRSVWQSPAPGFRPRRLEMHMQQRQTRHAIDITAAEHMVRRLAHRGERIEAGAPARLPLPQPATPQGVSVPLLQPVPRVVRRSRDATYNEQAGGDDQWDGHSGAEGSAGISNMRFSAQRAPVASNTSETEAPPVDINRLTDRIVQAIDTRIIAQRERLGKM